jgi:hypothetical protein
MMRARLGAPAAAAATGQNRLSQGLTNTPGVTPNPFSSVIALLA